MNATGEPPETGPLRVVLVGSGRTGLRTARILATHDHDVVVVERRADQVQKIADEYVATVIEGDATRPSILEQADLQQADVIAGLTDTTATNLAACTIAKQRNPTIRTVMRTAHDDPNEYDEFVDETFVPEVAGAKVAASAVELGVQALEGTVGEIEILDIEVGPDTPVAGKTLEDVALPRGSLVVTGAGGDSIADAETELLAGQSYVLAVDPSVANEVINLFRG
ncbi:TrkA family potassium uptake protein [Halopenitus sp. H-Gu1]|uniref:potassium channel family protein n=1 Tax=Halopenitus sp. H-Gu1 TaxID=3242697 RepID=UPI00359DDFC0